MTEEKKKSVFNIGIFKYPFLLGVLLYLVVSLIRAFLN